MHVKPTNLTLAIVTKWKENTPLSTTDPSLPRARVINVSATENACSQHLTTHFWGPVTFDPDNVLRLAKHIGYAAQVGTCASYNCWRLVNGHVLLHSCAALLGRTTLDPALLMDTHTLDAA